MSPRRRRGRAVDGILLLDKPTGLSSNEALQRARRLFGAAKAGHTGSLDVLASGLLPLCFGEATKVCQFLLDADKRYRATFLLGARTTTGDAEGDVVERRSVAGLERATVERAVAAFRGPVAQVPPMHSALKRNGQPLYRLAHQGIEVPREERNVVIHAFDVLALDGARLEVEVACSKGTYIRTLAEDLGASLGCGAHVAALRRTAAGPFVLGDALSLERLAAVAGEGEEALDRHLLPADRALESLPGLELPAPAAQALRQGQAVRAPFAPAQGLLRLYDGDGVFLGVGEAVAGGRIAPRRLFHPQAGGAAPIPC